MLCKCSIVKYFFGYCYCPPVMMVRTTMFVHCLCYLFLFLTQEFAVGWISSYQKVGRGPSSATTRGSISLEMGSVSSVMRRVRDSVLNKERSRKDLKVGIAGFYDRSSKLWEDVWGEVRAALLTSIVFSFVPLFLRHVVFDNTVS